MRSFVSSLMMACLLSGAESHGNQMHEHMTSAEIDATFAKIQDSLDVIMKPNFALVFRVNSKPGSWTSHEDADEIWMVRRGSAQLSLGESESSAKMIQIGGGDVVNVPRTKGYQIHNTGRLEYMAIRIFPTERHARGTSSQGFGQRSMPDVVTNAHIDQVIAESDKNQPLHSHGAFSMNMVIYKGAPGPYEAHAGYDQIYFVRLGSAKAKLDGFIENPKEPQPGEIRGTGVTGAREYSMAAGDILFVPRNTAHFMDPGLGKYSYLLAHIRD
jgi:mannose-6-phosphate isomerase-like protein (cupin superfamily)